MRLMPKFDLVVIGGGSGLNVAAYAAKKGLSVAVIEAGPLGGTCLNRGCIPSKMLIESAEVAETIKRSSVWGIQSQLTGVDFPAIMKRTADFVDEEAAGIEEAIAANPKYTLYKHFARFTGPKKLMVGKEEVEGEKIVIAAGTRPAVPPIQGLEKTAYQTSDTVFRLTKQPKHVVFIGGGYISCEMAHFFGGLGSEVTIIDRGNVLISNEDEEVANKFTELFGKKYRLILNAAVNKVSGPPPGQDGEVSVEVKVGEETKTITGDLLFVAVGRVPNTDTLGCKEVGISLNERGFVSVNEYMETNVPGVWALGDVVGKVPFKHGANWEAKYVTFNAIDKKNTPVDYRAMPHAVYSSPQVAGVGLREQDLSAKGESPPDGRAGASGVKEAGYVVGRYDYIKTGMGKAIEDQDGFVKILVDRATKKIVGAHILGTNASVLIHEIVVAMKAADDDLGAIKNSVHIHPALSEVVQRAANSVSFKETRPEQKKTLMERTTDQEI